MNFDVNDPEVQERFMAAYGVVRRARERRLLREVAERAQNEERASEKKSA